MGVSMEWLVPEARIRLDASDTFHDAHFESTQRRRTFATQ
jgi:hypothetical protein